jgi:PAS domain S-box-containing protein
MQEDLFTMNQLNNNSLAFDFKADDLQLASEDDELFLAPEESSPSQQFISPPFTLVEANNSSPIVNPPTPIWKVMIVDDDPSVHQVTKLALRGFTFQGQPLTWLSAHSCQEAQTLLAEHSDIALILLDVVMEENDTGLQIVRYIRETLQNKLLRIILRTGQPGEAPEKQVIIDYDINDYKLKPELNQHKLWVTLVTGLRAYYDLMSLELNRIALQQILEAMPVGVCVFEAQSGKPTFINQPAHQLLGKGLDSAVTADNFNVNYQLVQAGSSEYYPLEKLPLITALQGQSSCVNDVEIRQSQRTIPVEICGKAIEDDNHQVIYALSTIQDITTRKQAEADKIQLAQEAEAKRVALCYTEKLAAKNAQLLQLNQDKDELLGIAAHDLKNPLVVISNIAELIQENFAIMPPEKILSYMGKIYQSSERMSQLINQLLNVNVIEAGKFDIHLEAVDILAKVQKILNHYGESMRSKSIVVHLKPPSFPLMAWMDSNISEQILENLISNAIKYSPLGKAIWVRIFQLNQYIRCEIQDQGPGLCENDLAKLFGKFSRLTPKPTGGEGSTGLGLFIVNKLVKAMKGKVWCESKVGEGSNFIVELPRS